MRLTRRSLAWLTLLLAVLALWTADARVRGEVLYEPHRAARVYFVGELSLAEALESAGLVGVLPSRAGRVGESWSLEETIRTGSRSPVPPGAPRWTGEIHRVESLAQVPRPGPKESVFAIGLPRSTGASSLVPIVALSSSYDRPALLTSPSTRQPGLIAATDLATTLSGRPIGAGQSLRLHAWEPDGLRARVATWESQHRAVRFLTFVPWALAALLLVGAWRRVIGNRLAGGGFAERPGGAVKTIARFAMAYPLGLLLVPMLGVREAWIYFGAAAIASVVAASGRRGVRVTAWATVGVVALDQLLGGWVLARTPLSYSPLEAARFYGIGNEAGGYLIGAALVACAGDLIATALLGVAVSAFLGAPMLGANFGCFLASVVAFSVSVFCQVKWERRVLAAASLAVVALLGVFLVVRGSAGTHLGRAAGGAGEGRGAILARKLSMNAHLTLTSPWALLALVQVVLLWRRPKDAALLAGAGSVWLFNDSGVVAAALLLLWHEKDPGAGAPGSRGA